jgi:hypothetical protein
MVPPAVVVVVPPAVVVVVPPAAVVAVPPVAVVVVAPPAVVVVVLGTGVGDGWPTLKNTAWRLPTGTVGAPLVAA